MESIRVYNDRKYNIGLILQNGREQVIKHASFVNMLVDEVEYQISVAPGLFEGEKQLRLSERGLATELRLIEDETQPIFDEVYIREQLNQRPNLLAKWLDGIQEPYLLDMVYDVASAMDLPASKLKLLKERLPSKEFIGSDE